MKPISASTKLLLHKEKERDFCIFVKQNNIVMTTLTLKINERTKKGKAFLEMAHAFFEDSKEIEIIKVPNNTTQKAINDAKKGVGLNKSSDHKDLMDKLIS